MTASASPPSLHDAIVQAKATMPTLAKDGTNTYLNSKYLTLNGLLSVIEPALQAVGIRITNRTEFADGGWSLVTQLVGHGQIESTRFPIIDLNPQKLTATCTYARRVNLMNLLSLVAEDDDGQAAAQAAAQAAPPAADDLSAREAWMAVPSPAAGADWY